MHAVYRLFVYVLSLEIQLSRWKDWDPINQFNTTTVMCFTQARTLISNVTYRNLFVFREFNLNEK